MTTTHAQLALSRTLCALGVQRRAARLCALSSAAALLLASSAAHAQAPSEPPAQAEVIEPTAQQRQAAAEAYDRGTAAYLSRDYVAAARWFETAHRMAPASSALVQAVRAHQRADNVLRASNLALRLQIQYGDDRQAARVAGPIVTAANRAYVRVDVTCAGCTVDLDGTLQEWTSFYLEPGGDHVVGAHFETGDAEAQHVTGTAGVQKALSFMAPPPPAVEPETTPEGTRGWPAAALRRRNAAATGERADAPPVEGAVPERGTTRDEGSGLPPAVFIVTAALTVAAGGVLVWSGLDTTAGVAAYEAEPTQAGLEAGQAKELRTNILIAGTSVLGATALLFAVLTNWGGRGEEAPAAASVRAGIAPVEGGAVGVVGGNF